MPVFPASYSMKGGVTTRRAYNIAHSRKVIYRKRVKTSKCRGWRGRTCKKTPGCKYANGRKRSFCRKIKNKYV